MKLPVLRPAHVRKSPSPRPSEKTRIVNIPTRLGVVVASLGDVDVDLSESFDWRSVMYKQQKEEDEGKRKWKNGARQRFTQVQAFVG